MLSFAITVCDELTELQNLITFLSENSDLTNNEIIVQYDNSKNNIDVKNFIENNVFINKYCNYTFDGDFAALKNNLNAFCSKPYIFQLDADELPNLYLLNNLNDIIKTNTDIDLFRVPRENFVNGITVEHLKKWNWNIDKLNRINFPDYQGRIYKNISNIYWTRKVHEYITGARKIANLPPSREFSLLHIKNIDKQEKSFDYYSELWESI